MNRLSECVAIALRLMVGAVLLSSGLIHSCQPFVFAGSIAAYELFPFTVIAMVVLTLPAVQIVLGTSLIGGWYRTTTIVGALALFTLFVLVQGTAMAAGRRISCGCFGLSNKEIGVATIALPAACVPVCVCLLKWSRRR